MTREPSRQEFAPPLTGSVMGFPAHHGRPGAIGEVHARPHPLIEAPRMLVQLSFMTEGGSVVDHAVLAELSRRQGVAAPDRQARHYAMKWGKGTLRWERHTEFSTYLWEGPLAEDAGDRLVLEVVLGEGGHLAVDVDAVAVLAHRAGVVCLGSERDGRERLGHALDQAREIGGGNRVVADVSGNDVRRHLDDLGLVVHDCLFR